MADPQVMSWIDPVTGLKTSGIAGYQSGSTGGLNPTTMAQFLPPQYNQSTIPGVTNNPYLQNPTETTSNPYTNDGSAITLPLNPNQFATDANSAALLKFLGGGTASQVNLSGPNNQWPGQNQVTPTGSQNPLNSGLAIGELQRNGSGPGSLGMYNLARDEGTLSPGETAAQYALSTPGFALDPNLSNSGPGYNMVWDPNTKTYTNTAAGGGSVPGQSGMTQAQTIAAMQKFNGVNPDGTFTSAKPPTGGTTSGGTPPPPGGTNTNTGTSPGPKPPSYIPSGYSINPTTGLLQRNAGPIGTTTPPAGSPPNTTSIGGNGGAIRSSTIRNPGSSKFGLPGTQTPGGVSTPSSSGLDVSGLTSVTSDINGAYQGSISVNGQPQTVDVTPDGKIWDTNGQDITSQFGQSDLTSIYGAFGQASGDSSFSSSMLQLGGIAPGSGIGTPSRVLPYQNQPPTDGTSPGIGTTPPPPDGGTGTPPPSPPDGGTGTGTPPPPSGGTNPPPGGTPPPSWGFSLGQGNPYNYLGEGYTDANGNYVPPALATGNPGLGNLPTDQYSSQNPYASGLDSQATNNRDITLSQGTSIDSSLQNYVNYNSGQNMMDQGQLYNAYGDIANGQGGYTPAQQQAIGGNPYGPMNYFGGQQNQVNSNLAGYNGQINDQLTNQNNSIDQAVQDSATGVGGAASQFKPDLSAVTNNTGTAINSTLGNTGSSVNSYIDPTKLNVSNEYTQNYNVTPQDQQNIVDQAGRSVGAQETADEQRLMQSANAQGNMSPLAIAAARNRSRQTGAVNEANTMSNASIQAKQLQLNTTQQRENTRLGAAQNYAGLGTQSNLALGQQGLQGQQYLGALGSQNATTADQATLGAEQYLGSQNVAAKQFEGQSNLSNTQASANRQNSSDLALTGLGTSTDVNAEQQGSTRAKSIADQQMGQQQEYRSYLQNQQGQANTNVSVGNQQRLGAYGTQTGGINQATSVGVTNYGTKPGDPTTATNLLGVGAKGGVSQGPHLALVGEAGPELLVDLAPMKRAATGDTASPSRGDALYNEILASIFAPGNTTWNMDKPPSYTNTTNILNYLLGGGSNPTSKIPGGGLTRGGPQGGTPPYNVGTSIDPQPPTGGGNIGGYYPGGYPLTGFYLPPNSSPPGSSTSTFTPGEIVPPGIDNGQDPGSYYFDPNGSNVFDGNNTGGGSNESDNGNEFSDEARGDVFAPRNIKKAAGGDSADPLTDPYSGGDPYSTPNPYSGPPSAPLDPTLEGTVIPKGVSGGQMAGPYGGLSQPKSTLLQLLLGALVQKQGPSNYPAMQQAGQGPVSGIISGYGKGPLGGILSGLVGAGLKKYGMAEGGVAGPHHFYGSDKKLHGGLGALSMAPKVELLDHPQIRMLGAHVPQMVLPLTPRKSNKVTPGMVPELLKKYGGYGYGGRL